MPFSVPSNICWFNSWGSFIQFYLWPHPWTFYHQKLLCLQKNESVSILTILFSFQSGISNAIFLKLHEDSPSSLPCLITFWAIWNSCFFLPSIDAVISYLEHDYATKTEIIRKVSHLPQFYPFPQFWFFFSFIYTSLLTSHSSDLENTSVILYSLFPDYVSGAISCLSMTMSYKFPHSYLHFYQYIALNR